MYPSASSSPAAALIAGTGAGRPVKLLKGQRPLPDEQLEAVDGRDSGRPCGVIRAVPPGR